MLVGYLTLVANEVREILARLGLRSLEDLVGRSDLLRRREGVAASVDVGDMIGDWGLGVAEAAKPRVRRSAVDQSSACPIPDSRPPAATRITNTDRAVGAAVAGAIAAQRGDAGLPDGSVEMSFIGSAGQSFGAFLVPGMRLTLVGDANDGVGKGMHGGEIVVCATPRERGRARQVLAGNAALYGATGGRVFIGGSAGERFAVRNSGAMAVIEGAGDHACEYMTGGVVVILGGVGRNFGAGMTGGVAYVLDRRRTLAARINADLLAVEPLGPADRQILRPLLDAHERFTGSRAARAILRNDPALAAFVRVSAVAAAASIDSSAAPDQTAVASERAAV
jgi:glutamate synthase domain-containing protein 3